MTREEAKRVLEFDLDHTHNNESKEALRMAIKALEQEPKIVNLGDNVVYGTDGNLYKITVSSGKEYEQEPCEDAISRQAVVDFLENHAETYEDVRVKMGFKASASLINNRNNLPSVNPQPKTGHWIEHEKGFWSWVNKNGERDGWIPDYECSECGSRAWKRETNYCPQCGAKMVEPQETETWNGIHAQITAPKGTFERIFNDADDDNDI